MSDREERRRSVISTISAVKGGPAWRHLKRLHNKHEPGASFSAKNQHRASIALSHIGYGNSLSIAPSIKPSAKPSPFHTISKNLPRPQNHARVGSAEYGRAQFGIVSSKQDYTSFTRQLAFNDDYKQTELKLESGMVVPGSAQFYNESSSCLSKFATLLIFGLAAGLLVFFWYKNRELDRKISEKFWREDQERAQQQLNLMQALLNATGLLNDTLLADMDIG